MRSWLWRMLVCLAVFGITSPARSDDGDAMRRIDFRVDRTRDVANDWVTAAVGFTAEDVDSGALASRVNETMRWGLDTAKGAPGIRVKTGGYSTSPVYQDGRIRRWRASQNLILESGDVGAVSDLVGKLQEKLQLQSIAFTISPESRREVEDELIQEALAAFRARADLVRESLGANGYQIVRASIDTGGGPPVRPMMMAEAAMARAPAPPALESGSSELRVTVQGTIELE